MQGCNFTSFLSEVMCKECHDNISTNHAKLHNNVGAPYRESRVVQNLCRDQQLKISEEEEGCIDKRVVIVGAGPAGLATAVCLKREGVDEADMVILEKSDCIASLWRKRTYDRLCLHVPKQLSELPYMGFPRWVPKFPTRRQFLNYLDEYAAKEGVQPRFNEMVLRACWDKETGRWHVRSCGSNGGGNTLYRAQFLVVASGENAEPVVPAAAATTAAGASCCLPGLQEFSGQVLHSSQYRNGEAFQGQRVLVVGFGNSGMEVSLDLANFRAKPSVSVRSPVHVLPREIYGISTFSLAMTLSKILTLKWTDRLLLLLSRLVLGDPSAYGFKKPTSGPLELKETLGKTPLLDVGTLTKIKDGSIQVVPAVQKFTTSGCYFADGSYADFEAVILATGYQSNVPSWLQVEARCVKEACAGRWKSRDGLFFAGFNRKGLLGISMDARRIAADISKP